MKHVPFVLKCVYERIYQKWVRNTMMPIEFRFTGAHDRPRPEREDFNDLPVGILPTRLNARGSVLFLSVTHVRNEGTANNTKK
jgi:hypothetical protein